jgi:hypothetical protein
MSYNYKQTDLNQTYKLFFYEQCGKFKNKAQLELEEAPLKSEEIHEEFFEEINNYKEECVKQFKKMK